VIDILGLWGDASDNIPGVPGIGEKTIIELLKQLKSVQRISYATLDELEAVVGVSRAEKIYNYYHQKPVN